MKETATRARQYVVGGRLEVVLSVTVLVSETFSVFSTIIFYILFGSKSIDCEEHYNYKTYYDTATCG